jgi:hypothetical protein
MTAEEIAALVPTPEVVPIATKPTVASIMPPCVFCGGATVTARPDGVRGYECPECDSIFLSNGKGISIASGVIDNIAEAQNLPVELSKVSKEVTVTGPFRGNALLFQIPEITLPSMQSVVKAALKSGLTVERIENTLLLTKE